MTHSPSSPFELSQLQCLQDRETAAIYLEECLADGDIELFQAALQDVAKAQGGVTAIAQTAELNSTSLYRSLSKTGKPQFKTISKVLSALGMRMSVTLKSEENAPDIIS
ncbi:addiction module antidote protein [Geminocystis sp. CENA526]|uniref:addiction module antidote protein n=1 Tax=Geminocystis sp. CENA526 TaxID=1355871 RepID=UPI003D6F40B8